MSMTLILWKAPVVDDPDAAAALLRRWYDVGDESAFEPSTDLAAVHEELVRQYPISEGGTDPWAEPPELTERLLVLSIRWSADNRVLADITALARRHGLVVYDPQGPDVLLPHEPLESLTAVPLPAAFEWLKAVVMAAVLLGLTYAAWHIPVAWVRWPAVAIAGFVAAAGVFVFGAMVAGALGWVRTDVGER
jgi:hypothetical protein